MAIHESECNKAPVKTEERPALGDITNNIVSAADEKPMGNKEEEKTPQMQYSFS